MAFEQSLRMLIMSTPLGPDEVLLTQFNGREELSQPFQFLLDLISDNDNVAAGDLVGKPISWQVNFPDEKPRYFHGLVRRLTTGASMGRGLRNYRVEVVPKLWFLSRSINCKIYQNLSVPSILDQVFADFGITDVKSNLTGTYAARVYCVQYRETALDFISRLMEDEGIYYYFTHEKDKHTLVLADTPDSYTTCDPHAKVEYRPELPEAQVVTSWQRDYFFVSGKFVLQDYEFTTPSDSLVTSTNTTVALAGVSKYERFEFPSRHTTTGDGAALAVLRMEEEETGYDTAQGTSRCSSFCPSSKFTIENHPADNGEYTFIAVEHSGQDSNIPGIRPGTESYSNSFTVIPASVKFRPKRLTPRPLVHGPQSALVVGPDGEEIYTDEYGRVKVHFYWDRIGGRDQTSSCWIRVSESWAGANWGSVFLPRIGQEVLVEFLHGDPDRPIITGRVYNANLMPPYTLPDNQTQSGLKTRSTKGGSSDTFNELRFEDKKDSEDIYFHAQKDFHRMVENDDDLKVDHDQTITIKNDRTITVAEGNETLEITKGTRTHTVKAGTDTLTVESDRTVTVKTGNDVHNVDTGNHTVTVKKGNEVLNVDTGNRTVTVKTGNDELTVTSGNHTIKISAGASTIEAAKSITLKVGSNKIEITPSGITITGTSVKVTGEMAVAIKGVQTEIKGDAMVKVQGGIVMLN